MDKLKYISLTLIFFLLGLIIGINQLKANEADCPNYVCAPLQDGSYYCAHYSEYPATMPGTDCFSQGDTCDELLCE